MGDWSYLKMPSGYVDMAKYSIPEEFCFPFSPEDAVITQDLGGEDICISYAVKYSVALQRLTEFLSNINGGEERKLKEFYQNIFYFIYNDSVIDIMRRLEKIY